MITIKQRGSFKKTEKFLSQLSESDYLSVLNRYGQAGVDILSSVTPFDTGNSAKQWDYEVRKFKGGATISWTNSNMVNGIPVVILLQYGHGTRNGGYVQGRDFINPALKPIFDKIAEDVWKEVTK